MASLGLAGKSRSRALLLLPIIIFVAGTLWISSPIGGKHALEGTVAEKQSPYADIRAVDKEGKRFLLIDGSVHTIVDPNSWQTRYSYVNVIDIAKRFFEKPGKLLLIGLGGGSIAKHFAAEGWSVDAVEIDPVVTRFAFAYFGLDSTESRIFNMDGRHYLITCKEDYDVIVLDAFGSSSIPFHLVTTEAFELISKKLKPGGILAVNVESIGWTDIIVRSLDATLKTRFSHVLALPIAEPPNRLGNVILFASDREFKLLKEISPPTWRFSAEYDQTHAWDNRFEPSIDGVPVLTDDLNPVDVWAERINLAARRNLQKYFGRDYTSR
jgi:spermidine synthase